MPSFNLQLGDIKNTEATLDEIFRYLNDADKPCIVAIDEFQQISTYAENNMEAILRTHVQHCNNSKFIFAGSQRHMMGNIFLSASRPFYQSVSIIQLGSIEQSKYINFARLHFRNGNKQIKAEVIKEIYSLFDGVTWYMQKMLNVLYSITPEKGICEVDMIPYALNSIINSYKYTYSEIMFRMPAKQKELLIAIAKEDEAKGVTSGEFVNKYKLTSSSSVQSALKGLLDKDFITFDRGLYQVYDRFFNFWLKENY